MSRRSPSLGAGASSSDSRVAPSVAARAQVGAPPAGERLHAGYRRFREDSARIWGVYSLKLCCSVLLAGGAGIVFLTTHSWIAAGWLAAIDYFFTVSSYRRAEISYGRLRAQVALGAYATSDLEWLEADHG